MKPATLVEVLLVGMAGSACAKPTTPPASITAVAKRQDDETANPMFIGWFSESGTYNSWGCREGSAFETSSSFARCCPTGSTCLIGTTCLSGSIIANRNSRTTCSGTAAQASCVTGVVYHSIGDQDPIYNYQCWPQWNGGNWEAVRVTTTQESSSSATATASTGSFPSSASVTSTASPDPTEQNSEATSEAAPGAALEPESGSKSKAWIAGPVIGGLAGAALFTGLGIWLYRRRLQRQAFMNQPPVYEKGPGYTAYAHEAPSGNDDGVGGYRRVEAEANAVYEMPAEGQTARPVEMDAGGAGRK